MSIIQEGFHELRRKGWTYHVRVFYGERWWEESTNQTDKTKALSAYPLIACNLLQQAKEIMEIIRWEERPEVQLAAKKKQRRFIRRRSARIVIRHRAQLGLALRTGKASPWFLEFLGCTIPELWEHLEKQFSEGMTRKNHGHFWQIHHIHQCSKFNLLRKADQEICFHFSNLKPLRIDEHIAHHSTTL